MTGPTPNGRPRRFTPEELEGAAGLRPDDLPSALHAARELEGLAVRSDASRSPGFTDRVMAAIDDEPSPVPARAAGRAIRRGSGAALLASIRDAWRITVRPGFPHGGPCPGVRNRARRRRARCGHRERGRRRARAARSAVGARAGPVGGGPSVGRAERFAVAKTDVVPPEPSPSEPAETESPEAAETAEPAESGDDHGGGSGSDDSSGSGSGSGSGGSSGSGSGGSDDDSGSDDHSGSGSGSDDDHSGSDDDATAKPIATPRPTVTPEPSHTPEPGEDAHPVDDD
jgi:uncharacterized membrane protein YgcG